jgi:hypothetical protein
MKPMSVIINYYFNLEYLFLYMDRLVENIFLTVIRLNRGIYNLYICNGFCIQFAGGRANQSTDVIRNDKWSEVI